ncbi:hypothetical protein AB8T91_26780, partial [Klebsiella pneumoniae]
LLCHGTVCVVGKMRDLILQLSKSSIYSTKPFTRCHKRVSFVSTRFLRYFNIYERDHKHISSWGQDSEQNARAAAAAAAAAAADRMAETLCGARQ